MGRLHRLWRRRTADVLGALLVIAVAGGAAAVFALKPPQGERAMGFAPSAAKLPACREVDSAVVAEGPARCRDGRATVELVSAKTQLVVDGLEVRVLGVERRGHALSVRLRFRNKSTAMRVLLDNHRQIYLDAAGRRVYGRIGRALRIKPNTEVTATSRFADLGTTLGATRGVWLGVVPVDEVDRAHPSELGAIQLELPPEREGAGNVLDRSRRQTASTSRRPATRPPPKQSRGAQGSRQMVRLTLVATAPVYVCVRAGQRVLVPGRTLQAGEQAGPFRAQRFTMTLGNMAIRMRLDGHPPIVPTASPSGYLVDRRGARALPVGRLPTCGG
jgi:hypothetical protein